ncbi:PQQ-dependent sugar dehydrogenase [Pontibacter fetidus]|uniref:T9SS type A sorting domain-containing protein n=1 Tax=Pontibacter fetidus TaxID=2700082 RepID=A0A6B2H0N7_9BACT|nr:PQQ-dependent sugar dehydrogenase [Pontibacter fetidus]NDK55863.1 T9SS type A sorting domain-containing protein [Pontibacter fetidus]
MKKNYTQRGGGFSLLLRNGTKQKQKSAWIYTLLFSCFLFLVGSTISNTATAQPSGFVVEDIGGAWNAAVGLTFSKDGKRMYVWEKGGKVWIVENGEKLPTPLVDITEEVADWGDHGLLGFAIDPNFDSNGYIYLYYAVDRHHLMNFGTANYSSTKNEYYNASIGRITRYTARTSDGRKTVDPASRKILVGETKSSGVPILYESHGVGSLYFGEDGSLLFSAGDGATGGWKDYGYYEDDPNKPADTFIPQALADGIIVPEQNVGAFRAQQTTSINGKILRINPATGDGYANNPFYDGSKPRSAASRVWAMGFRNPFRFTIKAGTGSATNPGVIYLGDVGWQTWEELNVVTKGGQNFGWPVYEGLLEQEYYYHHQVAKPGATNPLHGQGTCNQPLFYFQDLIYQPKQTGDVYFGNPCQWETPIPSSIQTFVHTRPAIDWGNREGGSRTGIFKDGKADVINIGAAGSPVSGPQFSGSSATGGVWYTGTQFPAEYRNVYFFGDYGAGWIKVATFDANHNPKSVRNFIDKDVNVVDFAVNPVTNELYFINYATQVKKVNYYGDNIPPKAVAKADKLFGSSPLTVKFNGSESTDPEGKPLTYEWNFGDGSAKATTANPEHTFTGTGMKSFEVVLKVTDAGGSTATSKLTIILNNTPPKVEITSPAEGTKYPLTQRSVYNLRATVTDTEHSENQLTYAWQTTLHHNEHEHPEPIDNKKETTATIIPIGCDNHTYFYRISLTVTDAGGLATTDYVDVYPDCSGGTIETVSLTSPANNASYEVGAPINLSVKFADTNRNWSKVIYYAGTNQIAESSTAPFTAVWNGATAGTHNITAQATDDGVHYHATGAANIAVGGSTQISLPNCLPGVTHYFGMDELTSEKTYKDFASASLANCTDCPTPSSGKFYGGATFGNTSAVNLTDGSKFNWGKNTPFAIDFWMRTTSKVDRNSVIIGRNATSSQMHWWIGMDPNGYGIFMLKDAQHHGLYIGEKGPKLNDGVWHHVTAVRDAATNKNILYIDGIKVDEAEIAYDNGFEGTEPINIGYLEVGDGYHFNGELDEFKLYDRALTATEVASEYNGGQGAYCGTNPLGSGKEHALDKFFEVYPNPAKNGNVNLWMTELTPNQEVTVQLSDLTGKKIIRKTLKANAEGQLRGTLQPKKLSTGLYNLTLTLQDGTINRKIVVLE